jgi:hypothetical protein
VAKGIDLADPTVVDALVDSRRVDLRVSERVT